MLKSRLKYVVENETYRKFQKLKVLKLNENNCVGQFRVEDENHELFSSNPPQ